MTCLEDALLVVLDLAGFCGVKCCDFGGSLVLLLDLSNSNQRDPHRLVAWVIHNAFLHPGGHWFPFNSPGSSFS